MSEYTDFIFSWYVAIVILMGNICVWGGLYWHFQIRGILQNHNITPESIFNSSALFHDLKKAKLLLKELPDGDEKNNLKKSIKNAQWLFAGLVSVIAITLMHVLIKVNQPL